MRSYNMGAKNDNSEKVIEIVDAEYVGGYRIRLTFNDRKKQTIDFESFVKSSHNPMTSVYKDLNKFKSFSLQYGDLVWGDYEMCFPVWDLYQGRL